MRRLTRPTIRRDQDRKRRMRLATMAGRAAIPERPFLGRGPRYLIHPHVSVACGSVLLEIARDLRDQALAIDSDALDELATFLQGPDSSLFELKLSAAADEAARLLHLVRRRGWESAHEFALPSARA
jgi:hypothetical protein